MKIVLSERNAKHLKLKINGKIDKHYLIFAAILFAIFLLRLPGLFEPYWYGDEGIFAAVARNLNLGGVLYQTAWDNKPPMIYLTYAAIFQMFGVSMFFLRMAAAIAVLVTAAIVYEIGCGYFGKKRALFAMGIFGFLMSLRVIEGNLALTEIFMILPISLAILISIKRDFDYASIFISGSLIAIASLFKQVGAFEAGGLGLYIFLLSKNAAEFVKKGIVLTLGFTAPLALTAFYFARLGTFGDFIFAAYTYYQIYLEESPQYAILINILKYSPILIALGLGVWAKRRKQVTVLNLFLLWAAFSFLGSYFSGRAYGHYMIQTIPAISLLLCCVPRKLSLKNYYIGVVIFVIPLIILTRLLFNSLFSWNPTDQITWWQNFIAFSTGAKSADEYSGFFDKNVNKILAVSDFLKFNSAAGKSVYIWGDLPWIYAISDVSNPSRYVTSFHVFGVPNGKAEVILSLLKKPPVFIIKPPTSIGYFLELENLISQNYTLVSNVEGASIYTLK